MTRGPRGAARLLGAMLCCAGVAAHAAAQGLGAASGAQGGDVRLTTDIFGGWDKSLRSNRGLYANPALDSLTYGGANLSLAYGRPLSRTSRALSSTSFNIFLSSSARYTPQAVNNPWLPAYGLGVGLTGGGSRWSWGLSEGLGYGSRQATSLFAGAGIDVDSLANGQAVGAVDYQISDDRDLQSNSTADLGFALSRKDRIGLTAGAGTVFTLNGAGNRYLRLSGGGAYTRQVSRYLGVNVGYRYEESRPLRQGGLVTSGQRFRIHGVDFGVNYARPLRFSRNTTVSIRTGAARVPQGGGGEWKVVGGAGLTHQFKRTWAARVNAARAVRFVPAFPNPTLTNGVSVSVGGTVSRRASVSVSTNYAVGQSGFGPVPTKFHAYSGRATVRYAIFGYAGLYAEYFYFQASVRSAVQSAFPPGEFARNGVRVGASFGTDLGSRRR